MELLIWLGAGAGALLALGALANVGWRIVRRAVHTADLVDRTAVLVTELSPDHGHSIKDQVTTTAADVAEIKTALAEHLRDHP